MRAFRKVVFALTYLKEKGSSNDFNLNKGRGKDQKGKGKEGAYLNLNPDFQPLKHPEKKDMAIHGNQTIGLPGELTIPLVKVFVELLHGKTQDIWHGWHQSL